MKDGDGRPALNETEDVGAFEGGHYRETKNTIKIPLRPRQDTILETPSCETLTEARISNSDITGISK